MAAATSPGQGIVLERIDQLRGDVAELKDLFRKHVESQTTYERESAIVHAELDNKSSAAHRRLDEQEAIIKELSEQVQKLRDAIQPLVFTNKILTWLGLALGGSVLALIWSIVTHQVSLVIP